MGRTKRIFISDLHMGDERSSKKNPPTYQYPYGWIMKKERINLLADFLKKVNNSSDVLELIILGDLLDQWVCPVSLSPADFDDVLNASTNKPVKEALLAIDNNPDITLVYVPGNHDMLLTGECLTSVFKNIVVHEDSPGVGVYRSSDGVIAAEHGSLYTMFCSPDTWDNSSSPIRHLPLGFFISRIAADKEAYTGEKKNLVDYVDIIAQFILDAIKEIGEDIILKENLDIELAKDVFLALSQDFLHKRFGRDYKNCQIILDGLDNFPQSLTINEVANIYKDLFREWGKHTTTVLNSIEALFCEIAGLQFAARKQYFENSKEPEKIVIFGHTHHPMIEGYRKGILFHEELANIFPCEHIYANTGTWIDSHTKCSYVETERDEDKGRYYVRLHELYKEDDELKDDIKEKHISLQK